MHATSRTTPSPVRRRRWAKPVAAIGAVGTSAALAVALLGGAASAATTTTTSRPALARPAAFMGAPRGRVTPSGRPGAPASLTVAASSAGAPAVVGTVKSVSSDSFTVESKSGTVYTVDVSSSTTYKDSSVSSASLSNVTTGETVAVVGTDSDDTVTATQVLIGTPPSTSTARPALGARPMTRPTSAPARLGSRPTGAPRGAMPLRR